MPFNKYDRKPKTNIFHIRIGNNIDKINIKDPLFLKLLQQQYATKYLQSLGVQATQKNINKILKANPIQNCQILQSRLNGGLYTDTITIIPRTSAEINESTNNQKQHVSSQMIQMLDLKRMGDKKYNHNVNTIKKDSQQVDNGMNNNNLSNNNINSNNDDKFRIKSNKIGSNMYLSQKNTNTAYKSDSSNYFNNNQQSNNNNTMKKFNGSKREQQNQHNNSNNNNEGLKYLSFDIQHMKLRYIFPFNDNFKRKNNYKITDNSNLIQPEDPKIVYESKMFHFPFTQVKLTLNTLKQLQNPIQTKLSEIEQFLQCFYQQFPIQMFPLQNQLVKQNSNFNFNSTNLKQSLNPQTNMINTIMNNNNGSLANSINNNSITNKILSGTNTVLKTQSSKQKTNLSSSSNQNNFVVNNNLTNQHRTTHEQKSSSKLLFKKKQIDQMFEIIRSQSNGKLIGVFLHLAYWCIFGGVNPIQIESTMKKKMYIMMFQTLEYFQIKVENKKLWATLVFPMILLTLKMAADYFFQKQYPKIYQNQQSVKNGINQLAFDKILYLIERMFDQTNINGRFIFLQSQITGTKGTFLKDKQYIRKRIFGTSPALQIILPNPKNGKTRSIMAKNVQKEKSQFIQMEFGKISTIKNKKQSEQENKQCREKLLCLALHKINNRLEEIQGHSTEINPIINLKI